MATTSITEDFVTKSGLNVQGTSTVTSSTGQTGALQVDGGAAIAKNLIVGSTATVGNDLFVIDAATVGLNASIGQSLNVGTTATINGNLFVYGHSRIVTMTATGAVSILETTAATTGSNGALVVVGGAYLGKNLVVLSTVSSTGTTFNNAVYIAGGVGIDKNLVVGGTSVFQGDVIFNGTATYVYSANTVYTDNILELHTPNTGTPGVWNADDGKDIGLRFHYYAGANKNAALVLANDTKYLEWYESGAEGTDTFAGGVYGTFKTGNVLLTGTTNATTTQSGALQVVGGLGIGSDLYVGGKITAPLFVGISTTATNIAGGTTGSIPYQLSTGNTSLVPIGASGNILFSNGSTPYWDSLGSITPDYANTATNIRYGAAMEIPFQTAAGITSFEYNLRYDYLANTLRTVNAVFTGTTNASNTVSGALQVAGGVGIGGNIYVGQNATIFGTADITGDTTLLGNLAVNGSNTRLAGDLEVNGGDITTNQSTFNLLNTTATTVNFAGSATAITIGSSSGYTTIGTRTTITNTTSATSTITGALRVAGGVGIGGSVYIGGQTNVAGSIIPTNNSVSIGSLSNPFAELFLSANNSLYVGNVVLSSTGAELVVTSLVGSASLTIPTISVTSSTISNSTDTGALTVVGGVGIGGALNVGGSVTIDSTAVSTGTNSGALVIGGGVGIGGTLYVNTTSYIHNSPILTAETIRKFSVSSIIAGTDTAISTSTGDVVIWNVSNLQSVTNRGNVTTNSVLITNTTDASSTNSGALQVGGGVGIGGNIVVGESATVTNSLYVGNEATVSANLYVGGNIVTTATTFNLINTSATTVNFAGAGTTINIGATTGSTIVNNNLVVTGNLTVHGTSTIVDSTVTNISDPILMLGSGPNNSDLIFDDNKDRGIAFKYFNSQATTGFFGYQNSTGYLTFFTSTTIDNEIALPTSGTTKGAIDINLAGGTAQALVYQSSPDATSFVAAGSAGYLLQTNGTGAAPSWISPSSLVLTTATNLANGTAGQVPYQTAPGLTSFYGPGIAGNVLVSNGTGAPSYNNTLTLTGTNTSINTTTGALQVVGGVGIGGDLYVGGSEVILGTLSVRSSTTSSSTTTGALQVVGGVGIGKNLWIGGALNAASTSYINGSKILVAGDLETVTYTAAYITNDPTSQSGLVTVAGTSTSYGTYDFGTTVDVQTFNDYNTSTNTGYYSIHDAATTPGAITYVGFTGVTDFNRFVLNINYTANSGHTQEIDLYNWVTLGWDTFTTYSGSTNWFQFIEEVINPAPYISNGQVVCRIYHLSFGNINHRTWIDYVALEKSIQGGQGPRGATGATGAAGPQGLTTTTTSTFIFTNTTDSISTNSGAVVVYGGVGIGKSLFVGSNTSILSTASSTSTLTSNALYVAGGVGIGSSLLVTGPAVFQDDVTFSGATTYVYSTNTVYTDNIIELHSPGRTTSTWSVDDGKDIGIKIHYYANGADQNGALLLANDTKYLEWYSSGNESTGTTTIFSSGTYGTFKTGSIILTNSTASISTTTGALVVTGGAGFGGSIYAGNDMYSKGNLVITTATINQYASQTTITAGTDTAVSTSTGNVVIWDTSTLQSVTSRGNTTNKAIGITNTSASTLTNTGNALYVEGGVWITKSLNVNGPITGTTATITQVYGNSGQFFGDASGFGALYAGIPIGFTVLPSTVLQLTANANDYVQSNFQNINNGPKASTDWVLTSADGTNFANFIDMAITSGTWDGTQDGSIGNIVGPNDGYLYVQGNTSTVGQGNLVLGVSSTGSVVKIFTNGVGASALVATFNAPNTVSTSTATGALVVKGGVGISGNVNVGGAITATTFYGVLSGTATNLALGSTGSIAIQSASGQTAFIPLGTNGYVLTANATTASWAALSGLAAGRSTTATNLDSGTAGQIPYQTAPGATSFITTGTVGTVLVSNGTSAPAYQNTLTLAGTATSISTTTGALQVRGGVGVGGSVYVGNRVGFVNTSNVSVVYQYYNAATNSLDTVFG